MPQTYYGEACAYGRSTKVCLFSLFSFFEFADSLGELSNKMSCLILNTLQKYKKDSTFGIISSKTNQNLAYFKKKHYICTRNEEDSRIR